MAAPNPQEHQRDGQFGTYLETRLNFRLPITRPEPPDRFLPTSVRFINGAPEPPFNGCSVQN